MLDRIRIILVILKRRGKKAFREDGDILSWKRGFGAWVNIEVSEKIIEVSEKIMMLSGASSPSSTVTTLFARYDSQLLAYQVRPTERILHEAILCDMQFLDPI